MLRWMTSIRRRLERRRVPGATAAALMLLALGLPFCTWADSEPPPGAQEYPPAPPGDLPDVKLVPAFPHLRFERPVFLTYAEGDPERLFVIGQAGRIHVFPNRRNARETQVFLDLRERVAAYNEGFHNEEGLLALAFHPHYAENGFFYVYYSAANPRRGVLSRFRVSADDPNRADPASEKVILEVRQPYGNHNGSTVLFGPDGYVYMSLGDGGSANDPHGHGQDLGTLLGTILRIDVDREEDGRPYAIPPDNPFVDRAGARGEIWAYGLRNVWRMSFDRETGELWAGDVGQNRFEEIDRIVKGGNYGWNAREGFHAFQGGEDDPDFLDPVTEYSHELGLSVTGGAVYRGDRLPGLRGAYVFGDYATGVLWALRVEDGELRARKKIGEHDASIASFAEGPDAELYVLAFDGRIHRLEARSPDATDPTDHPS